MDTVIVFLIFYLKMVTKYLFILGKNEYIFEILIVIFNSYHLSIRNPSKTWQYTSILCSFSQTCFLFLYKFDNSYYILYRGISGIRSRKRRLFIPESDVTHFGSFDNNKPLINNIYVRFVDYERILKIKINPYGVYCPTFRHSLILVSIC